MEPVELGKTLVIRKEKSYVGQTDRTIVNATYDCEWFVVSRNYTGIQGSEFEREFSPCILFGCSPGCGSCGEVAKSHLYAA